ncbi:MAG: hypothetical protein WHS44_05265 [Fimbriimonadales bacterium]|nr:MAG: DNA-binding protein [Fimbriimonadales bacterium]
MGDLDARGQPITILLNCTVLSNFAVVNRLDLLQSAARGQAATTEVVIDEFNEGVVLGYFAPASLDWLPVLTLSPEERVTFHRLRIRLGAGEASCFAVAHHRGLRVATDDSDARRYAQRAGIPVSGTLGILAQLVRSRVITLEEGNALLAEMVQRGYRAPLTDLSTLLE